MATTITEDNLKKVLKDVQSLTGSRVVVGVPDSNATRSGGAISNAALAYIHENGSPTANIPARPFLYPGIDKAIPRIITVLRKGAEEALAGKSGAAEAAQTKVGLIAQNSVRAEISSNILPALAPRTLAKRKARGRTGERTLVDTGQLRAAITFVIEKLKGN